MKSKDLIAKVRTLLAQNELAAANQILLQILAFSPELDDAIQQSARFAAIQQHLRKGLIDIDQADAKVNQVRFALLELVRNLEKEGIKEGLGLITDELSDLAKEIDHNNVLEKAMQHVVQNAEKIYNIGHIDQANFY